MKSCGDLSAKIKVTCSSRSNIDTICDISWWCIPVLSSNMPPPVDKKWTTETQVFHVLYIYCIRFFHNPQHMLETKNAWVCSLPGCGNPFPSTMIWEGIASFQGAIQNVADESPLMVLVFWQQFSCHPMFNGR